LLGSVWGRRLTCFLTLFLFCSVLLCLQLTYLPYFEFFWTVAVAAAAAQQRTQPSFPAASAAAMSSGTSPYPSQILAPFVQSLRRTWRAVKPERMSFYTYITAMALGAGMCGVVLCVCVVP
jgi:hypothetical protein